MSDKPATNPQRVLPADSLGTVRRVLSSVRKAVTGDMVEQVREAQRAVGDLDLWLTERQRRAKVPIEHTDLRAITRRSNRCHTTVWLLDREMKQPWLEFGEAQLMSCDGNARQGKRWTLRAYLGDAPRASPTDFEHDSAYALSLDLVAVELSMVDYHQTSLVAVIEPDFDHVQHGGFNVPRPGYDPAHHPETYVCKQCKGTDSHLIVPEGFYLPPFDAKLYHAVRGARIEVRIGLTTEE